MGTFNCWKICRYLLEDLKLTSALGYDHDGDDGDDDHDIRDDGDGGPMTTCTIL